MSTVYISNDINCPCNIKKCTSETIESCCGCPEWFKWKHDIDRSNMRMKTRETVFSQYRKKPVVVEAAKFTNLNAPDIVRWIGEDKSKINLEFDEAWKLGKTPPIFSITIYTLEGDMKAMPGDYIIKGVHGEFYPCKPDIFEKTYEAVEAAKEE